MKTTKSIVMISALSLAIGFAGCESHPREVEENQSITTMNLDIQNFNNAAKDLTNQMLVAKRVQDTLAAIQQQNNGKLPLIKISRIRNDTDLKVNMVDYFVTPIEEVFTNSGKVDFFSEDQQGQDIAAAQNALGNGSAKLPDLVLWGTVTQLGSESNGTQQNAYVFQLKLTDTANNSMIFIGQKQILKQRDRAGLSF